MSLFAVNRYLGEEDVAAANVAVPEGDEPVDESVERKRLKKLLKKAKIRKSLQVVEAQGDPDECNVDADPPASKVGAEKGKEVGAAVSSSPKKRKRTAAVEEQKNSVNGSNKVDVGAGSQVPSPKNVASSPPKKLTRKEKQAKKKKALAGTELGVDFGGFTVIGDINQFKQQTVKRVLPDWLANPSVVSCNLNDDNVPIDSVGLDAGLVTTLKSNFIPYLFPVQQQVIPWLISCYSPKLFRPSDICVSAPTGSGKTLSYALPIIHILSATKIHPCIKAIVVLPTEVLATQVHSVFKTYAPDLSVFLMSKRFTFSAERESLVKRGISGRLLCPYDVIIATPGRLVDHLEHTEGFDISELKFLVVDEADRTLDDQEGEWLERLEAKFWSLHPVGLNQPWKSMPLTVKWMPYHLKAFQKLLFSATLSQNPESLEKLHLFEPKLFTSIVNRKSENHADNEQAEGNTSEVSDAFVGKYSTPKELKESYVLCKKETKPLVLSYLISHFQWKRVLCFANTKENTHRLCLLLKFMGNLNVKEISSKWSPKTRDMVLQKFANGSIDILVTSDQMARGIDIPSVDYVISYDLPGYTKTYIHRIGRCARAGREGQAVSLVQQEQIGIYKKTMKQTGKTNFEKIAVKNSELRPLEESFKAALEKLKSQLEEEEDAGRKPSQFPRTSDTGSNQTATEVKESKKESKR